MISETLLLMLKEKLEGIPLTDYEKLMWEKKKLMLNNLTFFLSPLLFGLLGVKIFGFVVWVIYWSSWLVCSMIIQRKLGE